MQQALTRFAAPAGLLLAVTIAVLLLRPALHADGSAAPPQAAAQAPAHKAAPPPPRKPARAPAEDREFYEIHAGDTLGVVASRYETTVSALAELNPGIDPGGLQVGQRIRVK